MPKTKQKTNNDQKYEAKINCLRQQKLQWSGKVLQAKTTNQQNNQCQSAKAKKGFCLNMLRVQNVAVPKLQSSFKEKKVQTKRGKNTCGRVPKSEIPKKDKVRGEIKYQV